MLLLSGGYSRLEKVTTVLVGLVTLYTVVSVVILQWTPFRIHLTSIESGFKLAVPAAALALAFSAFGITGVGAAELFAYPYWCIEKGYARTAVRPDRRRRLGTPGTRLDPRHAARRLVQHGRLHGRHRRLLPAGRRSYIPRGSTRRGRR